MWFAWPHNRDTWPGRYDAVPSAATKLMRTVADFVPVRVLASADHARIAAKHLGKHSAIELVDVATNDCWIRDYGPTFVIDSGRLVGVDWRFNAWGGKYPPWVDDAEAARQICRFASATHERSSLCLEGGAIEGDGRGRMLTTPGCVHTVTRNRGWGRARIARELHKRLGVTEIVWVDGGGLEGDDTDGHIDQLARFVSAEHLVVAVSDHDDDRNRQGLELNERQLRAWGESTEPRVTIHRLPTPPPRFIGEHRVPESYCNFLMVGRDAVIVPTFRHRRSDTVAIATLKELCPGAAVIGVDAHDFAWGLGAWHCASQQQPRVSA